MFNPGSLALVGALAVWATAHGQGTFQFTVQLTSPITDARGQGTFTLTETLFTYDVTAPWGADMGEIRGPGPYPEGPLLFNVRLRYCDAPGGGHPGACFFQGSFTLSEPQAQQLLEGQWYARAFVAERVSLQGPIVLVPEASPSVLLALGLAPLIGFRLLLRRRSPPRR